MVMVSLPLLLDDEEPQDENIKKNVNMLLFFCKQKA
jgi:hypothetical protein